MSNFIGTGFNLDLNTIEQRLKMDLNGQVRIFTHGVWGHSELDARNFDPVPQSQ